MGLFFTIEGGLARPVVSSERAISATLKNFERGSDITPANITQATTGIRPFVDLAPGTLQPLPEKVCGLDSFKLVQADLNERTHRGPVRIDPLDAAITARFSSSMVFARPGADGVYDHVIGCSNIVPTCTDITQYRGWPLVITFRARSICDYDKIYRSSVRVLDDFFLSETNRTSSDVESRWLPAILK